MAAYKVNITINDTYTGTRNFYNNVMSIPLENDGTTTISFKSQVIEFNEKNHMEIPITCISSTSDIKMATKIIKLQKGNKIEITGNLTRNDREEIKVLIKYIVYANTNTYSSANDKKELINKIPWLSSPKKDDNQHSSRDTTDNLPSFLKNKTENKAETVNEDSTDNEVINVSDDNKDVINESDDNKGKKNHK